MNHKVLTITLHLGFFFMKMYRNIYYIVIIKLHSECRAPYSEISTITSSIKRFFTQIAVSKCRYFLAKLVRENVAIGSLNQ